MIKIPSFESFTNKILTNANSLKIQYSLVKHVYDQALIGLAASLFCATIVFASQLDLDRNNFNLYLWSGVYLIILLMRIIVIVAKKVSKHDKVNSEHIQYWRRLYILGSLLGGLSWGLAGVVLLPTSSNLQQMLMILMLAGVTAGAVPLSAGILTAAIAFLLSSLIPFLIQIALFEDKVWFLFNGAMSLYLIYTIILAIKGYHLLRSSVILKFENDILLQDLEITNTKLQNASTHDALTGLPNRRFFEENIKFILDQAKANKKYVALLYLDLDHFKEANDKYGHSAGDAILLTVTKRLIEYLGNEDQIARIGGDELVIIIENITPQTLPNLNEAAKKVCQLIAIPISYGTITLKVSASIGVSIYPLDGKDESSLLSAADKRMYKVKKSGGNAYIIEEKEDSFS